MRAVPSRCAKMTDQVELRMFRMIIASDRKRKSPGDRQGFEVRTGNSSLLLLELLLPWQLQAWSHYGGRNAF